MKHCEAINMSVTPVGAVFQGERWPAEIEVSQGLLDYSPGPHVHFGRAGVLTFKALNGYAIYRRLAHIIGGWTYHLVESNLRAADKPSPQAEPRPQRASKQFRRGAHGPVVEAFQWLPHAVPPVELPDWFLRSDFQHVGVEGKLILRSPTRQPMNAFPGEWIVQDGGKIFPMPVKGFLEQYREV